MGIGHLDLVPDSDGTQRKEYLLLESDGKLLPSLSLLAATRALDLTPADIHWAPAEGLSIGGHRIHTDSQAAIWPKIYAGRDGRSALPMDSFSDVISGKIPASKYANKVVFVGVTSPNAASMLPLPGIAVATSVEFVAHTVSSVLSSQAVVRPSWEPVVGVVLILLTAVLVVWTLPRLPVGKVVVVTIGAAAAIVSLEAATLVQMHWWLRGVLPALLLLLGGLVVAFYLSVEGQLDKLRAQGESDETSRQMALALQSQGQLDAAFDRLRRIDLNDVVMDNLYNLALDFERKRQYNKAEAVYQYMHEHDPSYQDLEAKLQRARSLSETVILGGKHHPGGGLILNENAVEKPMLGRYQIDKELSKGAMGVVYLGRDPKIGRVVAIKTMSLSQEFLEDDLEAARERFFREAETAGRLQHANIVTIYDAGEEQELAYIAMEFLKGHNLTEYCKATALLPVDTVLDIVAKVADALDYAHAQSILHRDIKPANIMYEPETGTIKVTDFGIARITDSSKTKTGMVLGSPSYMSPEQLAGKPLDGRTDLYSLGVMLFQLLTGVLPYRGDSLAQLMYKITNEPAPNVSLIRRELSDELSQLVAKSMGKTPEGRFQSGAEMARWVRAVKDMVRENHQRHESSGDTVFQNTVMQPDWHKDNKTER